VGSREVKKLTKQQKDILIGKLLGDGFLEHNGKYSRLKIDHSFKQKDYVFWLYRKFDPFVAGKPYQIKYFDKRVQKFYYHWRFSTKSLFLFEEWRKIFYREKRKIIPLNIDNLLISSLSLAVWYMDDGYKRRDCKGLYLCTSAYTSKEQNLLQKVLLKNFGIETKIHYAAGQARIYIPAKHSFIFFNKIKKYIIPIFSYKLP
jgi:hypothetical protein